MARLATSAWRRRRDVMTQLYLIDTTVSIPAAGIGGGAEARLARSRDVDDAALERLPRAASATAPERRSRQRRARACV